MPYTKIAASHASWLDLLSRSANALEGERDDVGRVEAHPELQEPPLVIHISRYKQAG